MRYNKLRNKLIHISGHIPWWHHLEGNLLLIVIVVAVVLILVMIIVCVVIFIVCRRKRNQMKCKLPFISRDMTVIVICCSQRFAWRSRSPLGLSSRLQTHFKKLKITAHTKLAFERNLKYSTLKNLEYLTQLSLTYTLYFRAVTKF